MKPFLIPLFAVLSLSARAQFGSYEPPKKIPAFALYTIQADHLDLSALSKGKITIIDFWFVPCGPCFAEMNMLHTIYDSVKSRDDVVFLAITFSDSAFVRPLMENRNAPNNEIFDYFKSISRLDSFRLPTYFIQGCTKKIKSLTKSETGNGYKTINAGDPKISTQCPEDLFHVLAYPTLLIYNKQGELILHQVGYAPSQKKKETRAILKAIRQATL